MLQFSCHCGQVFSGQTDRDVLVQAVDHAGDEHGLEDARAQVAVEVLDALVEA
jgi:predicted small metal-binding protein